MKNILLIIISLYLVSCNDKSIDYDNLYADAGVELTDVENKGYTVTLDAGIPTDDQTGQWTIVTGVNGVLSDSTLYNSEFSGEPGQTYVLEWLLSNPVDSEASRTTVSFKAMEPEIYMILTDTIENMYLNLSGSMPRYGASCSWEIINGDNGQINNADSLEASLWGDPNETYEVQFSHHYGSTTVSESFEVTLGEFQAFAGIDMRVVPSTSEDDEDKIITLWASCPYGADGTWNVIGGANGQVLLTDDPNSLFIGNPDETYTLEWEVQYNGLSAKDTVEFSIMGTWGLFVDPEDNNEYRTVIIDDLEWMAENYRYTYYSYDNDGNYLEEGNWWYGHALNSNITDGAPLETEAERRKYGKLYPYAYAEYFAPEGWRLPTEEEFIRMSNNFGGMSFAGSKILDGGESGLDLVCGGYHASPDYFGYGNFSGLEVLGAYWFDNKGSETYGSYAEVYAPELTSEGELDYTNSDIINSGITRLDYALNVRYVREVE